MELPVVGSQAPERADAARNRRRILVAAERLFAERGVAATSMEAIAAEAGVGKGTLFRRFGDRASLAQAVLSDGEQALQDAIIAGPPPLGPGAPPLERIVAFGEAAFAQLERNAELQLDAEGPDRDAHLRSPPSRVRRLHLHNLVAAAQPECDVDYTTDLLLLPLTPSVYVQQRDGLGMSPERLRRNYAQLVERLLG